MSGKEILVYIDLNGTLTFVGRLWTRIRGRKESASFEYDKSWLNSKNRFSLEPALTLGEGTFHISDRALFGSIGDSAPDRWGRALMRRAERERGKAAKDTPRTLFESDYLLLVDDETRQGALRFKLKDSDNFLADSSLKIPPLVLLPKLLLATEAIENDRETAEELKLLLAPGSSLGGARPKSSVIDKDGSLYIAKFPNSNDEIDVVKWEAVALTLAKKAKIEVPKWKIEKVNKKSVLLVRRFDRGKDKIRIPFLSAMSMLQAKDNETRSYIEIADAIKQYGAEPKNDLKKLFRRIVFNILISNTDDHLRNHGFLYNGIDGWKLSPAYDLNPVPIDLSPRILSTNITEDEGTASISLAYEVVSHFELNLKEAKKIVKEVSRAVFSWQAVAKDLKLKKSEISRMETAFEH